MIDGLDEGETLPPPATDGLSATISFDANEMTCASLELNGVPCVRSIVIEAHTRLAGTHLTLTIDGHPACDIMRPVEPIDAGVTLAVDCENLRLPLVALRWATERTHVDITAQLIAPTGAVVARATHRIAIAPETHWSGIATHCESIAAFVTPNAPVIKELLREVGQRLAEKTGSSAMDGYLSGSAERAQRLAESCYEALAARGITYVVLQASFEAHGQKVRSAADVVGERLANCLDLSVTLAALLESCGLHPMIVVGDGHATVAFATINEHFADPVHDGATRLENRRALGELRVIEATALCGEPKSFGDALTIGERWLSTLSEHARVVDIQSARRAGFHPLPEAIARNASAPKDPVKPPPSGYEPVEPANLAPLAKPKLSQRDARLEYWKRKLLDLTLRNRLLNDRDAAGIPLVVSGDNVVHHLEDVLWDEKAFKLCAKGAMRDMTERAMIEELDDGVLRSRLTESELFQRGIKVYRDAKSSLEETGARSLFVALGVLEYKVEQRAEPLRAPLILVPVAMERISRSEGFRIKPVLDDTVPNVALVEYLRMTHALDIGLAGQLTEDGKGLELRAILARVRNAVKNVPGARVLAETKLGNYSFKKLPLFEEMRQRSKELTDHPVVAALLDRSANALLRSAKLVEPREVDDKAQFASVRLPLAADSSQIAAILSATDGKTFVLQGPPGTGKSQTITNLLTECMARGKRVLFIAEKSAALEVVSDRLRKTGLGAYALDLHADHATKTSFVTQMKHALEAIDSRAAAGAANFTNTGLQLDRTRHRIRAAGQALHAAHEDGPSAHDAIERMQAIAEMQHGAAAHPALAGQLDGALPLQATAEAVAQQINRVDRLAAAFEELPAHAAASFVDFSPNRLLSPEDAERIARDARSAINALTRLRETALALARTLGVTPATNLGSLQTHLTVANAVDTNSVFAPLLAEIALASDHATRLERLARAVDAAQASHEATTRVVAKYDISVLSLPLLTIAGDLRASREKFIFFRWLAVRKVRNELLRLAKSPPTSDLDALLAEIESLVTAKAAIDAAQPFSNEIALLSQQASAASSAPIDFVQAANAIESARTCARAVRAAMPREMSTLAQHLPTALREHALLPAREASQGALDAALASFAELSDAQPVPTLESTSTDFTGTEARLVRFVEAFRALPAWSAFSKARIEVAQFRLAPVADALLRGALQPSLAEAATEAELLAAWTREKLRTEPELTDCGVERMQELRRQFVASMQEYRKGSPASVALTLRDRARETLDDVDAVGMRQARSKLDELRALTTIRRPIRRVMIDAAPAIAAVKPIILASPLSASTMLPAEFPAFDLVVFDEASQVPVWDAACAILRAKASVIVGDSKQLPPTNFFDRKESDSDTSVSGASSIAQSEASLADMLEPLDSVLEEAIASGIPQRSLLWHYRSRDERLIEFSNRRSYGAKLQTFPAARRRHPNLGVEFRFVGGVYDRAGTSTNPKEAEAIVEEIRKRLLSDDACSANRSIGVVTFSVAQQTLVQDLLDEALDADAKLRSRFAEAADQGEHVFVKNLENVQGDERATMLFSICYGRDKSGSLYHNFGPLNLSGGERRLNVAVSRAREKVIVFSSIRASELDPKKCTSKGAQDLRDYLAFAELGTVPAARDEGQQIMEIRVSAIERRVARLLESRGFRADLHVGRSRDYRVSIAIALPEAPDEWILGVELDGAFHQTAPTVVDRELVRTGVLSSLGWRTIKVSAIDVLRDETKTVDRIVAAARDS